MTYLNKKLLYLCSSAMLLGSCSNEQTEMPGMTSPSEVRFSIDASSFNKTRALIGEDATGPKYGDIYILQTLSGGKDNKEPQDERKWAQCTVAEGEGGSLAYRDGDVLYWPKQLNTPYYFQAISVPKKGDDTSSPGTVEFTTNGIYGSGTVAFGGYDTGLEYFVATTVGPLALESGETVTMSMSRQVGKIIFKTITHIKSSGAQNESVSECEIIFPNIPSSATFSLKDMYRVNQETINPEPMDGRNGRNILCFYYDDNNVKGVKIDWKKASVEDQGDRLKESKTQAIYLPTFEYWGGKDGKPENQPGFFIIKYKNKSYTGNLGGKDIDGKPILRFVPGYYINVSVKLKDGPIEGGGNGSAIAEWNIAEEQDVPHYPVPGIYTAEDAAELLAALQSEGEIPARFFSEENGKKVIRLFTNIDWSTVTEKLNIPDGYILDGQGYNIKMGEGGSIAGEIEVPLYINYP